MKRSDSQTAFKLAHVILSLKTGGLEKLVVELALKATSRFIPVVCCLEKKGELAYELENSGIKVVTFSKREGVDILLPFKLAHFLRKEGVTIVHTHNYAAYFYGILAAKVAGVPIIIHTEHGVHLYFQIRRKLLKRVISPFVDKFIAVSEDVREILHSHYYAKDKQLVTILNGVDIDKYSNSADSTVQKEKIGLDVKTRVIGNVARLSPEKDHKTLLRAFSLVVRKIRFVKLVIVGDGILREELEKEAVKLGIKDDVIFLGLRNDVPELLGAFDLFVLSSIREGIPLTILEAMAAGLPVVATNVGGIPEVINGETGLIVPPKDPTALANAIIRVLIDENTLKRMGLKAKRRVIERFSIERTANEYEKVYISALREHGCLKGIR